jgi:hypothetical protein
MEGLDKGAQGPTSGCCAIEEEVLCHRRRRSVELNLSASYNSTPHGGEIHASASYNCGKIFRYFPQHEFILFRLGGTKLLYG